MKEPHDSDDCTHLAWRCGTARDEHEEANKIENPQWHIAEALWTIAGYMAKRSESEDRLELAMGRDLGEIRSRLDQYLRELENPEAPVLRSVPDPPEEAS